MKSISRLVRLFVSGTLLAVVAGSFSSCSTTETHEIRSDRYVHDAPRERDYYTTDHPYYSSPSYSSRTYQDTEEPADFNVVNQYDRMSR